MSGGGRKHGLEEGVSLFQHDQGSYQDGAIVRIKCHNFVFVFTLARTLSLTHSPSTYNDVEFNVGPNLNVVIGPNGKDQDIKQQVS